MDTSDWVVTNIQDRVLGTALLSISLPDGWRAESTSSGVLGSNPRPDTVIMAVDGDGDQRFHMSQIYEFIDAYFAPGQPFSLPAMGPREFLEQFFLNQKRAEHPDLKLVGYEDVPQTDNLLKGVATFTYTDDAGTPQDLTVLAVVRVPPDAQARRAMGSMFSWVVALASLERPQGHEGDVNQRDLVVALFDTIKPTAEGQAITDRYQQTYSARLGQIQAYNQQVMAQQNQERQQIWQGIIDNQRRRNEQQLVDAARDMRRTSAQMGRWTQTLTGRENQIDPLTGRVYEVEFLKGDNVWVSDSGPYGDRYAVQTDDPNFDPNRVGPRDEPLGGENWRPMTKLW